MAAPQSGPAIVRTIPPGTRRVRLLPRGDVPLQFQWRSDPQTNQWTAVFDQGVNLLVDGLEQFGSIDVSADRMVLWTTARQEPDLSGQTPQDQRTPLEVYMEGNVVFREGDRRVYAGRMYYDVRNQVGTILDADMLTPVPKYQGLLRLHAEVLQQLGRERFFAESAYFTPSRLGTPQIRMQASNVSLVDEPHPLIDPTSGGPLMDPQTGEPAVQHERMLTAENDVLYFENVPFFYWPIIATDAEEPTLFIRRVQLSNDSVFGTQIRTDFNGYQLLGIRQPPKGTDWDVSADYFSKRGFAAGTSYLYHVNDLFGIPGPTAGLFDVWGINDHGTDNLGSGRSSVEPGVTDRFRLLWQHREQLTDDWQVTAEVGQISDRNFLQEYFAREWNELKDQSTDVELKRLHEDSSLNFFASARLDPFFTETQWLPRGDHFLLGESLLDDRLTWFEHTSAGYADFEVATLPNASTGDQAVSHLPWESGHTQGGRFVTRNEFDAPFDLGLVRVVPYFLGELGYWGEDLAGNSLSRAYYDTGVRATLPMWSVDPNVESGLWNVHGLAHKIDFEAEYTHSWSNQPITALPLYDPLDDFQIEDFRRRFMVNTYGLPALPPPGTQPANTLPLQFFDERSYALRSGLGEWVTSPSMEIAGDLDALRLGVHQDWQTKRGMPDDRHIIDWIELDTDITFFPDASRDDFNSIAGLLDYDFTWHVGDRFTILSSGMFDFFDLGQKIVTIGGFLSRPPRGSLYAGVSIMEGPIHSDVLSLTYNYWMSPKWISSIGISADVGETKSFAENLRLTYVEESLLISFNFTVDPVRDTVGTNLTVEPRFLPKGHLGNFGGVNVPPAGAFGVE
jgi:hypothetical protein